MNNLSINPQQAFTGTYRINMNLKKGTPADVDRDLMLGQWLSHAVNSSQLLEKIGKNNNDKLTLDYVIPSKSEKLFEHCMQLVGQKFDRLG